MFEVQLHTECDGWVNTWTEETENHETKPLTFQSHAEAKQELDDFIKTTQDEYENGNLIEPYDINDFRIVPVSACNSNPD